MVIQLIGFPDSIAQDLSVWLGASQVVEENPALNTIDISSDDVWLIDMSATHALQWQEHAQQEHIRTISFGEGGQFPIPFHVPMLQQKLARLSPQSELMHLGNGWVCHVNERRIDHPQHSPIVLTDKETELLKCLIEARPKTLSKNSLLQTIWGYAEAVDTNTLETHIYRLRGKCEPLWNASMQLITTEDGYAIMGESA